MPDPTKPITLEVCADSLNSAKIAARFGAKRVELNSALELGGLTPSIGLVEQTMASLGATGCQVIAMVRPRVGGFAYDRESLVVMQRDIARLLDAGVDGVALGVLDTDGSIDKQANHALIQPVLDARKSAVFHRAFDLTPDPIPALDVLISLGFHRVLTSGQSATAAEGATVIRQLIKHAAGQIEVLPGSGITPDNVVQLVQDTGCDQVHASLRQTLEDPTGVRNPAIQFNSPAPSSGAYHQADPEKVAAILKALQSGQA